MYKRQLVERFEKEEVPFSVAVVDMDWHLVEDCLLYTSGKIHGTEKHLQDPCRGDRRYLS